MLREFGRCVLFSVLVWSFSAAVLAQSGQPPAPIAAVSPTVIDGLGKGTVGLIGPWQFRTGDDPAWASGGFDDSHWEQLRGDDHWGLQGHPNYTGFAWYRLHLTLNPAPGDDPDFHILLDGVEDAYELYWNGALIGHDGKLPPHPVWYVNQRVQTFSLGPGTSGVLALRVWKAPLKYDEQSDEGGLWNSPRVGGDNAISNSEQASKYLWSQWTLIKLVLYCLFAFVAVLSLVAWLPDRGQWHIFWIALFSALEAHSIFSYLRVPETQLVSSLLQFLFELSAVASWLMLLWLLNLESSRKILRLTSAVGAVCVAMAAVNFLLNGFLLSAIWISGEPPIFRTMQVVFDNLLTVAGLIAFVLAAAALWKRVHLDRSRWLVAFVVCLDELFGFTQFLLSQGSRFDRWGLGEKLDTPLFKWNDMPVNFGDVTDYLLAFLLIYAVFRTSVENRQRQSLLEEEFKSARELQQVLIPETLPMVPGFALTSAYRPAREVGGDFFQIIPLRNEQTGSESTLIVLGDVSGKGLRAAMTVSLIVGAIHALANDSVSPARLLGQLNQRLHGRFQGGFATCIALRLNSSGSCAIASAGHPGPFFNSQEITLPGSLPLGLALAATYEDSSIRLRVDDHLSLYTDGVLEARNPAGELFGFDRLQTLFSARPTATEASDAAVAFGQDDDITVLTLTRLVTGAESTAIYSTLKKLTRTAVQEASAARS